MSWVRTPATESVISSETPAALSAEVWHFVLVVPFGSLKLYALFHWVVLLNSLLLNEAFLPYWVRCSSLAKGAQIRTEERIKFWSLPLLLIVGLGSRGRDGLSDWWLWVMLLGWFDLSTLHSYWLQLLQVDPLGLLALRLTEGHVSDVWLLCLEHLFAQKAVSHLH